MITRRVAVPAVGVIALVLATAALSAGGGAGRSLVLNVRIEPASFTTSDIAPKGRSAGDTTTFSGAVTRAGKPFGRYEDVDIGIDQRIQGVLRHAVLLLPDGSLVIEGGGGNVAAGGWTPKPSDVFAVVGGTGAYAGRTGTARMKDLGGTTLQLTIEVTR
jgi:hypothetical protein